MQMRKCLTIVAFLSGVFHWRYLEKIIANSLIIALIPWRWFRFRLRTFSAGKSDMVRVPA